jgi:hypothetical protein
MRNKISKIKECLEWVANQKCLELYNDHANGRITINECIAQTNAIIASTQKRIQDETNRIMCIEYYWKQ